MTEIQSKAGGAETRIPPERVSESYSESSLDAMELHNILTIRLDICRFLIKSLGFSTVCCFALIFFQGFHPWGFKVEPAFLEWLCGVTIAKTVALMAVFV